MVGGVSLFFDLRVQMACKSDFLFVSFCGGAFPPEAERLLWATKAWIYSINRLSNKEVQTKKRVQSFGM